MPAKTSATPHQTLPKITLSLIAASILVALWSEFGEAPLHLRPFLISWFIEPTLPEIQNGQIWRLVTPIFVHFGMTHLVFNVIMAWQLGDLLERRYHPLLFLALIALIAAASNLAQYFASGPLFGGLSGVVYGLFGWLWISGRMNPNLDIQLDPRFVTMLIAWFFLCWVNFFGLFDISIANVAHTVGLLIGMGLGLLDALVTKRRNR